MSQIVLITRRQRCRTSGRTDEIVLHGIDLGSGRTVDLPAQRPTVLGASFCNRMGEWLLDTDRAAPRAA